MKKNAIILHKIKTKIMAKKITLIIGLLIALSGVLWVYDLQFESWVDYYLKK